MKICYLGDPESIHTKRWIKYFADKGNEVHLLVSKISKEYDIKNVKMHILKRYGPRNKIISYLLNGLPKLIQFRKLIRKMNFDIIHIHYVMDTSILVPLSGFRPYVVTVWGSDILVAPKKSRIMRFIVKYVLKNAALITCDAEHIKEPLVKFGACLENIKLVYFGTDTGKFNPNQRNNMLRDKLEIHDSPAVISCRSFEPIYDVESLIKAVPSVIKTIPDAKFIIIGRGSQEKMLKELSESLGIMRNVRFAKNISSDEFPQYIASSDIYVSTSLSDAGLSGSTAEAMACGLPVIITDFGDNREWVKDG